LRDAVTQDLHNGGSIPEALEERLKRTPMSEEIDLNRLRRQVSFDRLLARLFAKNRRPAS
jgi:hypothetical protein